MDYLRYLTKSNTNIFIGIGSSLFIALYFNRVFILFLYSIYFLFFLLPQIIILDNSRLLQKNQLQKTEYLLFFPDETLSLQEIDFIFETGNYLVSVMIDDTPMLFVFSIVIEPETGQEFLLTNKISKDINLYSISTNIIFQYNYTNKKVSILPEQQCIVDVKVLAW